MGLAFERIMVTGGAGFLGSRLCALLTEAGATELIVPRRAGVDLADQADRVWLANSVSCPAIHVGDRISISAGRERNPTISAAPCRR